MAQEINPATLFDNMPSSITCAVSYKEKYREDSINADGTINPCPKERTGVNINYHTDLPSAYKDRETLLKISNRHYFDVMVWIREE